MNFRQMEVFLAVVEEKGVSQAAKRLFVSQPSITQVLRKIESELGGTLFERRGRQLVLSALGESCLEASRKMLGQQRDLFSRARDIVDGRRGLLSLYIPIRRAIRMLPTIMPAWLTRFPDVEIRIHEARIKIEHMEQLLLEGKFDLALTLYRGYDRFIEFVPICEETMVFVAAKDSPVARRLLKKGRTAVSVREVAEEKFVLLTPEYRIHQIVAAMFDEIHSAPDVLMQVHTVELAKSLASSGIGCTIVPELVMRGQPLYSEKDSYVAFPVESPFSIRRLAMAHAKSMKLSRIQTEFIRLMRDMFGTAAGANTCR